LSLQPLWVRKEFPHRRLLVAILAAPVGLGWTSLALFAVYLLNPGASENLLFGVLVAASLFLSLQLVRKVPARPVRPVPAPAHPAYEKIIDVLAAALLAWSLASYLRLFAAAALHNPFGEWDARLFWNAKAKFYVRDPEEWRGMFSPLLAWAHPDYPLLMPGAVAWGWQWTGRETILWPYLVALTFSLSTLGVMVWYLLSFQRPAAAFLAASYLLSSDFFRYWSLSQNADIPFCFFLTASGALLAAALQWKNPHLILPAALLAGFSAWTKNEGLFYVLIFAGVLLFYHAKQIRFWEAKAVPGYKAVGAAAGLPAAAALILKIFLASKGDYVGSGKSLGEFAHLLFGSWEKTRLILAGFYSYLFQARSWRFLWIFFVIAVGVRVFAGRKLKMPGLLAFLAAAQILVYFIVIHVSPHPPAWQIETALVRLLLHASGLAVLFIFQTLSPESRSAAQ
jgi:hypothetical protein